jgi:hypothetical protein
MLASSLSFLHPLKLFQFGFGRWSHFKNLIPRIIPKTIDGVAINIAHGTAQNGLTPTGIFVTIKPSIIKHAEAII